MAVDNTASEQLIDNYIENFPAWSKEICSKLRTIIHEAESQIVDDWKCRIAQMLRELREGKYYMGMRR